jgi:large subunit ribosomal protein L5
MNRIKQKYIKEIIPAMQEEFGYKNKMAVPSIEKITINVGISSGRRDDKFLETVERTLTRISGQKPIFNKAKKAISAFKIREGNIVGARVTLRGEKMYDFLDKLISISLPRVRDFRGISKKAVDRSGNLNIGFKEHIAFVEIDASEVESIHGLEVCITTNAKNYKQGFKLFELFGIPFKK